jgi:predicted alpha/beta hydrolase
VESIDIRTADGWSLRADVLGPHPPEAGGRGVAVMAHAIMARRSEFDRPRDAGAARFLATHGWQVVVFDFRGHGDSRAAPRAGIHTGYDRLVEQDLPAACAFARSRAGRRPVVVVGHSLGGHVALAAQGSRRIDVDAIALLGACVWLRHLEPSLSRWWLKRATIAAIGALSRRAGRFPARALRLGSDDESRECIEDIVRFVRSGAWTSADGKIDYWSSLASVRVPVLQVVSEGDRFECPPESGIRFVAGVGGRRDIVRVAQADDGGPAPNHMGLVISGRIPSIWERIEQWMREVTD